MDVLADLLKITIPAAVLLYGMYMIVSVFLNKEMEKNQIQLKMRHSELILPIRLQAYERICLFLERIALNNLVMRVNNPAYSAREFQQKLLSEIRDEFNHNLSQQVYMSDKAWEMVKGAKEQLYTIINTAAQNTNQDGKSLDLAKQIFELMITQEEEPVNQALKFVKEEIRVIF